MKYTLYKKLSGITLGAVALLGIACNKDLHQGPIGATYSQEFWTTQNSVEQATVAMYGQFRANLRDNGGYDMQEASHFIFGDLTTGLFVAGGGDTFLKYGLPATNTKPFNFSYVPYWAEPLQNWSRFYQLIAQSNLILSNVPVMPRSAFVNESVRSGYLAEALFMRAYAYFYMIRVWGDPVYVSKTFNDVDYGKIPAIARTPEASVLDSCLKDLKTAAASLSFAGGDPTKSVRANKGSAYALIAHIYAWKHEYDSAHTYCQQVIDNGGYAFEPMSSYKNIWKGMSSQESIFELPMLYNANDPNFKGGGSWAEAQFHCFATFMKGPAVDNQKSSCWIAPSGSGNLFESTLFDTTNDARYKAAFQLVPASGSDPAGYMLTKYSDFEYQSPDTKSYPYINNDLVLLRLSDIYLLNAEALAYTGDLEGARHNLSFTEDRAGISNYQSITDAYGMIDEVVMERGRELAGEGQWFYDLVRTEPTQGWLEYVGYPANRVTASAKGYYWPLDMSTLFPYDNLLTQNVYWSANGGK